MNSPISRRILIADDDPAILRLVNAIVTREGYEVVTARDGREALKILQTDADFVAGIFDVQMPHIHGIDLARHMQTEKRLKRIPVMIMTAEQNPKVSGESFSAGAVVFLPKPFTTAQLQTMLRMLIAKSQANQKQG